MKWPVTIPAYGVRIPIVPEEFDDGTLGEYHETSSGFLIGISPDLPPDASDLTIAHEIIHVWLRLSGVVEVVAKNEELICNALAPLLVQLIQEVQNGENR
jgi:hypothetical protein